MARHNQFLDPLGDMDTDKIRRMILASDPDPEPEPADRKRKRYPSEAKRASGKATWDVGPDVKQAVIEIAKRHDVSHSAAARWLLKSAISEYDAGRLKPEVKSIKISRELE